jgi:type II secretory pathway component GspD/PulD (secretin)/LysM repeat protein
MKRGIRFVVLLTFVLAAFVSVWATALGDEEKHNFEWRGADLRDALRHVGRVYGVNIVLDSTIKGEVTMTLNNVTCEMAIQYLARSNGFNYRRIGDSYIVGNEATLKENYDVYTTKVLRIYYAEAKSIAESISVVVPGDRVRVDNTTNSLVVNATPLEHENVLEIIKLLDVKAPQIAIEARLEEMSADAKSELGIQASVGGQISWDVSGITLPDINLTLQAMQEQHKSRTVARPNITTSNGQEGKILVGEKVPIKITQETDKGTTTTIQFIEVGVKMYITPRINRGGDITLYLKPEVSTITSTTSEGYPSISTREVETVLRVKDGETIIIGGLMRQTDLDTIYKLPILSDLPIIGNFFKFSSKSTTPKTELVFFITPKITDQGTLDIDEPEAEVKPVDTTPTTTPEPSDPVTEQPKEQKDPADTETEAVVIEAPVDEPPIIVVVPADEPPTQTTVTEPTQVEPITTEPSPDPAITEEPEVQTDVPVQVTLSETSYIVKKGDTLYSIARKFGVAVDRLYQANGLNAQSKLEIGQAIKVPIPKEHLYTVKPGDTVWRIAKRYGMTVELLCEINNLADPSKISVGQVLILSCPVTEIKDERY